MVSNAQALGVVILIIAIVGGGGLLFLNGNQSGDTPDPPPPTTPTPTATNTLSSTPTPSPSELPDEEASTPTSTASETPTRETPTVELTPTPSETPTIRVNKSSLQANLRSDIINRQDLPQTVINESMSTDTPRARQLAQMAEVHSQRMAKFESVSHTINGSTARSRYNKYLGSESCRLLSPGGGYILPKTELEALYAYELASSNESTVAQRITDDLFLTPSTRRVLRLENARHMGIGVTIKGQMVYIDISVC